MERDVWKEEEEVAWMKRGGAPVLAVVMFLAEMSLFRREKLDGLKKVVVHACVGPLSAIIRVIRPIERLFLFLLVSLGICVFLLSEDHADLLIIPVWLKIELNGRVRI